MLTIGGAFPRSRYENPASHPACFEREGFKNILRPARNGIPDGSRSRRIYFRGVCARLHVLRSRVAEVESHSEASNNRGDARGKQTSPGEEAAALELCGAYVDLPFIALVRPRNERPSVGYKFRAGSLSRCGTRFTGVSGRRGSGPRGRRRGAVLLLLCSVRCVLSRARDLLASVSARFTANENARLVSRVGGARRHHRRWLFPPPPPPAPFGSIGSTDVTICGHRYSTIRGRGRDRNIAGYERVSPPDTRLSICHG